MSTESKVRAVTTSQLKKMKEQGEKISMITSYDYSMATIVDGAGIDIILVGRRFQRSALFHLGLDLHKFLKLD